MFPLVSLGFSPETAIAPTCTVSSKRDGEAMTVIVVRPDGPRVIRGVRGAIYPFEFDAADVLRQEEGANDGGSEQTVAMIDLRDSNDKAPRVKEFDAHGGCFPFLLAHLPLACDNRIHSSICALLRQAVDQSWRARAVDAIASALPLDHPACARLVAVLREDGRLHASSYYFSRLSPTISRRAAHASRVSSVVPYMRAREAQDWVLCVRLAAGHPFGVTIEQLAAELGVSLRTVKRIRIRLLSALPAARFWTPQVVIDALLRRLPPPP